MSYDDFLAKKHYHSPPVGFEPKRLPKCMFDFQRDVVTWACRRGRAALFLDTGLGKTLQSLAWAQQVVRHTKGRVLILAPLAVAQQTVREGEKFGINVHYARSQDECDGYNIVATNYEMLHAFDVDAWHGVVIDESSILKAFDGKTRTQIIESFARTPYRLACTATPAPNDFMELGNHSEFLGIMSRAEMLAQFFVHDGGETQTWRLKGHAEDDFWRWVCSWAVLMRSPADLGYDAGAYQLPPLSVEQIIVPADHSDAHKAGLLFKMDARTLDEQRKARRASIEGRVRAIAEMVNGSDHPWLVWCELNDEGDALEDAIDGAVQVAGADTMEFKSSAVSWFLGAECICDKLAACRKRTTSASTTEGTRKSGRHNRLRGSERTESTVPSIFASTTRQTRGSTSEHESSKTPSTDVSEKDTLPMQRIEMSARKGRRRSVSPQSATTTLGPTSESAQPSTIDSCQIREEGAQSVAQPRARILEKTQSLKGASTSITITEQGSSGESSAHRATSDSVSSETIQTDSSRQQTTSGCTCGHRARKRVLISKPSLFGWGLNFQHCADVAFCGISHSWESFYQAVRRCYRFGQTRQVNVYVVVSELEAPVLANLLRKEGDAKKMSDEMSARTHDAVQANIKSAARELRKYEPKVRMSVPSWLEGGPL